MASLYTFQIIFLQIIENSAYRTNFESNGLEIY